VECDICGKKAYVIFINREYQKVCDSCYKPDGTFTHRCETDPLRLGGNYKGNKMYYKPDYFKLYELLPKDVYRKYVKKYYTALWGLFDERILWTADQLRKTYGKMSANTWYWDGYHQYRGYRPGDCKIGAFFSQHKYGRGIDLVSLECPVQDIRDDIKNNPYKEEFKHITCIEDFGGMSWVHFDCRNWDKKKHGLLIVGNR